MMLRMLMLLMIGIVVVLAAWQLTRPPETPDYEAHIIAPDAELPNLGFQPMQAEVMFDSPLEPQPEYQYERWLFDLSACFETAPATITFDRIGLIAEALAPERASAWAFQQVMIADVRLPDFRETRYARAALDLAGTGDDRVWLQDWSLVWAEETYALELGDQLDLTLTPMETAQVESTETFHLIQQALQTEINNEPCEVILRHSFGEQLP